MTDNYSNYIYFFKWIQCCPNICYKRNYHLASVVIFNQRLLLLKSHTFNFVVIYKDILDAKVIGIV